MIYQSVRNSIDGWYFSEEDIKNAISGNVMLNPSIDLTNACNLNCPYCYIEEKNSERKVRKPNELTIHETLRIIDDFANCGAKTINIVGAGEPTIDPHFEEVINYIYSKKLKTVLFTNGIRFYHFPKLLRLLYDRNVSIVLKYNSNDNNKQDLVAGRKAYAEKRNKVLDWLIDYGFNSHYPTKLGIDIIVFNGNIEELLEIHKWCRGNNIFPIAAEFIPTGRTEDGVFQGYSALEGFNESEKQYITEILRPINKNDRIKLLTNIREIDKKFEIKYNEQIAYYGGGICSQILGLYVDIEGNIWPCVARKKVIDKNMVNSRLGNFRDGDLPSKLWQSDKYIHNIKRTFNGGCPYKQVLML